MLRILRSIAIVATLAGCGQHSQLGGTGVYFNAKAEGQPSRPPAKILLISSVDNPASNHNFKDDSERLAFALTTMPEGYAREFHQELSKDLMLCGISLSVQPVPVYYQLRTGFFEFRDTETDSERAAAVRKSKSSVAQEVAAWKPDLVLSVLEKSKMLRSGVINSMTYDVGLFDVARRQNLWSGTAIVSRGNTLISGEKADDNGRYFADMLLVELADKGLLTQCRPAAK